MYLNEHVYEEDINQHIRHNVFRYALGQVKLIYIGFSSKNFVLCALA